MKKILLWLLVLTMCISMVASFSLVGCKEEAASAEEEEVEEAAKEASEEEVAEEEVAEEEAVELSGDVVFWSMYNETEPNADVIKNAIANFEAANPEVNVTVQWNGREVRQILKAALDAGESIDIYENDPRWLATNIVTEDYALNLDDYYAKAYAATDGEVLKDIIIPALITQISSLSVDGGLYYVPNQAYVVSWYYSKSVFQNAGISEAPQTWAEFLDVCEKLKTAGVAPITVDDVYMDILMGGYLGLLKGEEWVSELMQDKTGEMWKDPAVTQFAEAFEELYTNDYFSANVAGNKYPAGQQELALEQAGMNLNGSWLPNELVGTTGPDFEWGQFTFPTIPNQEEDSTVIVFGSNGYAVNKNSENADAAFELITYIVSKEAQADFADRALAMPVTVDTTWPEAIADVKPIFEGATGSFQWGSGIWDGGDFSSIVLNEFVLLISGGVTAEEFVTNMEAAATK